MTSRLQTSNVLIAFLLVCGCFLTVKSVSGQCNVTNTGTAAAPACTSQSLTLGAGESRNIAFTSGVTYTFSYSNNTQSNGICVNGTQYISNPVNLTPSGTLETGMFRSSGTWTFSSAVLNYKIADPTTAVISSAPTAVCAGGTTAALAGNTPSVGTGTWTCTGVPSGGSAAHITFNSINSGSSTVTVNSAAVAGNYTLQWQINNGGCTSAATTTLTVTDRPSITTNPTSPSAICSGGTTGGMSIAASGGTPSLTYQWQYSSDNSSWSNTANGTPSGSVYTNATSASNFSVAGISAAGTYYYRGLALASGAGCTTAASSSASVSIVSDPSVTSQPSNATAICVGGSTSFNYTAAGGTPSLSHQWQYSADGTSGWGNVANGTPSGSTYSGQTTTSLSVTNMGTAAGTHYYRSVISASGSDCGTTTTNVVSVVANAAPSVSVQPTDPAAICAGGTTSAMSVTATGGTPSLTYQWQYSANNTNWSNATNGTPSGASYTNSTSASGFTVAGIASSGTYYYRSFIQASGSGCGSSVSNSASVSVVADPSVSAQPNNASDICVGGSTSFSYAASGGTPSLSHQWQYSADGTSGWSNVSNGSPAGATYSGSTTTSLNITDIGTAAGTYYYRSLLSASGSDCGSALTQVVSVTAVSSPSITSSPSSPAAICEGGSVTGLSFSAAGGTPSLTYQWQYSADNSSWSNVSNGTPSGSTYSNSTSSSGFGLAGISAAGTYYYRGLAKSSGSGCASAASSSATLNVIADPSITSASLSNTTICLGGSVTATTVATGGTPSLQYQWQYNNGGTWVNVAANLPSGFSYTNANAATMTINTALNASAGSFGYRCMVSATGSGCGSAVSSVLTLNSNSAIWLGNSSSWNDPNNWSTGCVPSGCNINVSIGTTANGPVVNTPVGVRDVTITGNVTITLNADLSVCGNWSGGSAVVDGSGAVVFARTVSGDQFISGTTEFNNLTIARPSGFVRTKLATSNISVKAALRTQSGKLVTTAVPITLRSTASGTAFVDDFSGGYTGTLMGKLTIQRYATGVGAGPRTQHQISTGLSSVRVSNFTSSLGLSGVDGQFILPNGSCNGLLSNSPYTNLMQWTPAAVNTCLLEGYQIRTDGFTQQGRGYIANAPNNATLSYQGNYTAGNIAVSAINTGNVAQNGYNFIGNPYASGVTYSAQAGMDANALVYVPSGDYSGTYQVLSPGSTIASSQGFWVRVTNPGTINYNFTNAMRVTGNPTWYRSSKDNSLVLEVEADGFKDMTTVAFAPEAVAAWDNDLDAGKLQSEVGRPTVYTLIGNSPSALNTLKSPEETPSVPMVIQCSRPGKVTISLKEALISPEFTIYLEDRENGLIHNLSGSDYSYQESCNQVGSADRFVVHFRKGMEDSQVQTPHIFSYANKVFVDMSKLSGVDAHIEIYNVMGQKLAEDKLTESIVWSRELNQLTEVMYAIVRVNNKGTITSRKVMIGNR